MVDENKKELSDEVLSQVSGGAGKNGQTGTVHIDSNICFGCGVCAANCPDDAIHEWDIGYIVDTDKCRGFSDCGVCVRVCPADCITY